MIYIFYDLNFVVKLCKVRVYLLLSSAIERTLLLLDRLFVKSVIYVTQFSSVAYFHQKYITSYYQILVLQWDKLLYLDLKTRFELFSKTNDFIVY